MNEPNHIAAPGTLKDVLLEMAAHGETHAELTVVLSETMRARVLLTIAAIETPEAASPGGGA